MAERLLKRMVPLPVDADLAVGSLQYALALTGGPTVDAPLLPDGMVSYLSVTLGIKADEVIRIRPRWVLRVQTYARDLAVRIACEIFGELWALSIAVVVDNALEEDAWEVTGAECVVTSRGT